jgi:hypothetical protein
MSLCIFYTTDQQGQLAALSTPNWRERSQYWHFRRATWYKFLTYQAGRALVRQGRGSTTPELTAIDARRDPIKSHHFH